MKCNICGKRLEIRRTEVYMVKRIDYATALLSRTEKVFDAVDCPRCGHQILLGERLPTLDPKGVEQK